MSEGRVTGALAIAVAAVWMLGSAWSVHTLRQMPDEAQKLRARQTTLAAMRALAAENAGYAAARERVWAEPGTPAPLAEVVSARLPHARTEDTRSRRESLGDGWLQKDQDLVFDEVPIASVIALVDDLETQRPPWRLTALEIRASAHTPGVGQVALTVTALQPEK